VLVLGGTWFVGRAIIRVGQARVTERVPISSRPVDAALLEQLAVDVALGRVGPA
jgi:hypothetical protein